MEAKKQKMTISIYRIDKNKDEIVEKSFDEVVKTIMSEVQNYEEENLKDNSKDIRIFYKFSYPSYEKWKSFFEDNMLDNNFLTKEDGRAETGRFLSFIAFFDVDEEIFVITAGKGYIEIERWSENYFGLEVITKLLDKNSNVLKRIADNSLIGNKFENIAYFRAKESFLTQDDFGKIVKEAIAELDENQLSSIGIDTKERINSKINCIAKAHFSPKTGVSMDELKTKIFPKIAVLMKKPSNFNLNKVKEISKKHPQYSTLLEELKKVMYDDFLSFDFFPPSNTDDFFHASKYEILKQELSIEDFDITYIEKVYELLDLENTDFEKFKNLLTNRIYAKDENDIKQKGFSLLRGLHGEFEFDEKKYFWLNGKMWMVDDSIIDEFNQKAFQVIEENVIENEIGLSEINLSETEGKYNESQSENFLVLDKKFIDNIEFADLFKIDGDTTYIIHVKKGFDRDMRALSSQISTSARLLQGARSRITEEDKNFFKELFSRGINDIGMSEQEFIDAIFNKSKNRKIVYILAFAHNQKIKKLEDIEKMKSSIAKLELFEIVRDFRVNFYPFELKIIQLDTI